MRNSVVRDAFLERFLARLPPDLAASFVPEQLAAIRSVFGARYRMEHSFDLRRTLHFPWGCFYLVVLLGREARHRRTGGLGRMLVDTGWASVVLCGGLSLLVAIGLVATWLLPGTDLMLAAN